MAKKKEQKLFLYPVEIESLEEGGFFASCPSLQGCHAEGETYSETIENIEDVIRTHLELRRDHNEIMPNAAFGRGEKVVINLPFLIQV